MSNLDMHSALGLREAEWLACTNPTRLVKRLRHRGARASGRKYLLLACAIVRHLLPGPRTPIGIRILDALERFALAQPAKGVRTHLWREVVRPAVPELPDPFPFWQNLAGADSAWVRQFASRLESLSRVRPALVNVIIEQVLSTERSQAAKIAAEDDEAVALAEQINAPPVQPLVAWYRSLFGAVSPPTPGGGLTVQQYRDEILARVAPERREQARAEWFGVVDATTARQIARRTLQNERFTQAFSQVNPQLANLIREVFSNPFRRLVIDPAWLQWNHGAVRHIAEQIAVSGNFGDMPILADALEDAGCTDEELLRHCREERTHVPGCWALDAVLGRG